MDARIIGPLACWQLGSGFIGAYFGWLFGVGLGLMGTGLFWLIGGLLPPPQSQRPPSTDGPTWMRDEPKL